MDRPRRGVVAAPRPRQAHAPAFAGKAWVAAVLLAVSGTAAQAQLFPDNDARKAILELRAKVAENEERTNKRLDELAASQAQMAEQLSALRRSLVDLNTQLELLRADLAKQRGADEQIAREVAELQRQQKDISQSVDERMRRVEPQKVSLDGREFSVLPDEMRLHDEAMAVLRNGDFAGAVTALSAFERRYPASGYRDSVQFWLGNALYGKRDYKEAVATFRAFLTAAPTHPRAPEAMLAIANCQVEMKDLKAARATLAELQKVYPASEAAAAGKQRLATLK